MIKQDIINALAEGEISPQDLADLAVEALKIGESVILTGRKGWYYEHMKTEDGLEDKNFNPTEDGKEKFYITDTTGNPHGAPIVKQETSLGIPFKVEEGYKTTGVHNSKGYLKITNHNVQVETNPVRGDIEDNIVGALITDNLQKVITDRFSWSGVVFFKNSEFTITEDNELIINGKSHGYLALLFLADKNRIEGYVGVFTLQKPDVVKIVEMEDLLLGQLLK